MTRSSRSFPWLAAFALLPLFCLLGTVTARAQAPGAIEFNFAAYTGPEVDDQNAFSVVPVTFIRMDGSTGAVGATLAVTGGALVNGTDFDTLPTTISFADGETSATVNIHLKAIAPGSLPGTIILGLSDPTGGATLGARTSATVLITPVTANVHFTAANFSGSEDVGGGQLVVSITREGNLAKPVTVKFNTSDSTAKAGTDYTAQTDVTVSFAASETTKTLLVDVALRAGFQGNRSFTVKLSSASAGGAIVTPSTASVTILESEPPPPGVIAFDLATIQANTLNAANTPNNVVVGLTRSNGAAGTVKVDVSVTGGTLVKGTDYTFTDPTTLTFQSAALTSSLTIPLKAIPLDKLPGTIVLTLSNPTNGSTLGAIATTTITLVAPGVISLSAPSYKLNPLDVLAAPNGLTIPLNRALGVNGAVGVKVSVSGGTLVNGIDYETFNPTTVTFADGVTAGSVHLQLKSIRSVKLPGTIIFGLSSTTGGANIGAQSTTLVLVLSPDHIRPVVVVKSPLSGDIVTTTPLTLTGKVVDVRGVNRVEVTLNGGPVQLATLGTFAGGKVAFTLAGIQPENGRNTLVVTAVDSGGNKSLPIVLHLRYFNHRPAFAGSYNGLLVPAVTPANNLSGLLKLTVTETGTFTGNVALGGFKLPLIGFFGNDGQAHFRPGLVTSLPLAGAGTPAVALGNLEMSIAEDLALGAKITGTLKSDPATTVATLSAPRNYFDALTAATTVDSRYTLSNQGRYTVVFPSKLQGALPLTAFPQGDGYASLTLTSGGTVTVVGKLADGAGFTASARLAKDYSWPFFAPLPTLKGSLAGSATFDDAPVGTDVSGLDLLWLRAAKPAAKYYPAGWPAGIQLDLHGAKFVKGAGASVLPGLSATNPTLGNASLVFSDGKLTGPLTKSANIAPNDVVTNAPTTDHTFTLSVVHGSGSITGDFRHSDNTRPVFNGIVFQKGPNAGAYGYFLSTIPLTPGATGESGGVSLNAK